VLAGSAPKQSRRAAGERARRGRNLGTALMDDTVISDIESAVCNFKTLRIQAQDYTIPFYECCLETVF